MNSYNHEVAEKLREIATLLAAQHANPFRTHAYTNAANTLDELTEDISILLQQKGLKGLIELPAIGAGIARSIYEYIALGRITRLENLHGASDPVALFQNIPAVGRTLAERIHHTLHIDTIEALENAAAKGELKKVKGLGHKRREAIQDWLIKHFGQHRQQLPGTGYPANVPDIALLLTLDAEYRARAGAGKLPLITPRRFNPDHKAWLPVWHCTRQQWHFTILYSNTERAHQLNRIYDWVIIYFYDDHHQEGQHTVVTETHGNLMGKRVIRGREEECYQYYS